MDCRSGCYDSSMDAAPKQFAPAQSLIRDGMDRCSDEGNFTIDQATKDACCSNKEPAQPAIVKSASCQDTRYSRPSEQAKEGDCCDSKTEMEDDGCRPPDIVSTGCQNGCCGGTTKETQSDVGCGTRDIKVDGDCCTPKSIDYDCKKSHRSAPGPSHVEDPDRPSCCKDKVFPCCDVTCLDRIALRECENEKLAARIDEAPKTPTGSHASSRCRGVKDGKPCGRHTRTARDKYAATLEALGCICRALLALGQQSCCGPQERSFIEKKRCSKRPSQSVPRASVDSCCATGASTSTFTGMRPRSQKGGHNASPKAKGDVCMKGCCGEEAQWLHREVGGGIHRRGLCRRFKGFSAKEHVILSISGMTCTGCETKLKRTLGTIESVKNLKTSLILARAEFDLDPGAGSLVEVMKHLERTTEFKCERVMNQGSSIDLTPIGDVSSFVQKDWPHGVTEMTVIDKKTVNVAFDAKIIGARDLVEKGWGTPINLAVPRADPTLEAGSKHVRHVGCMTLLSIVLTIPVLILAWAPLPEREIAYGSASLALATIVQFVIAGPFYPKALKSLIFSRMIEMDLLIVLSTSAAYIFSVVSFGYLVVGQPLSTAGASTQYSHLFIILMANLFAIFLQSLCIKLGSVTGLNLAENCRRHLPRWLTLILYVFAESAIIATDIAEVIGSVIALNLLLNVPLVAGCVISLVDVLILLIFYNPDGNMTRLRLFECFVMMLVLGVMICFCIELSYIPNTNVGEVFKGYVPSSDVVKGNGVYLSCGILGATVMPHSIFLGSGIVQPRLKQFDLQNGHYNEGGNRLATTTFDQTQDLNEKYRPSIQAIRSCLKYSIVELATSLFTFALFVNSAILIVAGSSLYPKTEATEADLFGIHALLTKTLSKAAGVLFALALLLSGTSAGIVCTMAGQMVSEGMLRWTLKPWLRRLITRSISIVPSIVIAASVGKSGLNQALTASQVVLSVILPFVTAPLLLFTCRSQVMIVKVDEHGRSRGERETSETVNMRNGWIVTILAMSIWLVLVVMNVALLVLVGMGKA